MNKFKVGDYVEVSDKTLASYGHLGIIKGIGYGSRWNIKVFFPARKHSNDFGFYSESELSKITRN